MAVAVRAALALAALARVAVADAAAADAACSCAPRSYRLKLRLDGDCDASSLAADPSAESGIGHASCRISDAAGGLPAGAGAAVADLRARRPAPGGHRQRAPEPDPTAAMAPPASVTSAYFFEFDASGTLTVIHDDDAYLAVDLADGDVLTYESVASTLNASLPLADQTDRVPGGAGVFLFGADADGAPAARASLVWEFAANGDPCNATAPPPRLEGETLGWIEFVEVTPALPAFCPAVPSAAPTSASPVSMTPGPTAAPIASPTPPPTATPAVVPPSSPTPPPTPSPTPPRSTSTASPVAAPASSSDDASARTRSPTRTSPSLRPPVTARPTARGHDHSTTSVGSRSSGGKSTSSKGAKSEAGAAHGDGKASGGGGHAKSVKSGSKAYMLFPKAAKDAAGSSEGVGDDDDANGGEASASGASAATPRRSGKSEEGFLFKSSKGQRPQSKSSKSADGGKSSKYWNSPAGEGP